MSEKILLDTDIGSDIDDAICLAYLLAQPNCDLLGITTVTGDTVKRAQMASAQCKVAGREIPIYPGTGEPLLIAQKQPDVPQAAMLDRWPHEKNFPRGEAVEFLRRTIRQHPGEITLLTIGPLTNIALLFHADPEIPHLIKQLVLMCGTVTASYQANPLEWNAILDPHAAAMVYRTYPAHHRTIGLDVTTQVTMPQEEVRQRFQTPLLQPVYDFAKVWFEHRPTITFHDPLAATTIFDDQICGFDRGNFSVELTDPDRLGQTIWQPDAQGKQEVALQVDSQRFFTHFFSVFG